MGEQIQHEYTPDAVSPPGETLRELLEERNMSQRALAERMGRPTKTINEIINARTSITPETALQLEKVLGTPAHFWNNREQKYQEYLARLQQNTQLEQVVDWIKKFPIKKMVKFGWIQGSSDEVEQLQILLSFLGVTSPKEWEQIYLQKKQSAAFRQSLAYEPNPYAVSAWLRYGELVGKEVEVDGYDKNKFEHDLRVIREMTRRSPEEFVPKMKELCTKCGVALVFTPQLPKTLVSGATRWLNPNKALIQLSLRYKTNDHFWFTFFHEAAHILLHGKKDIFLENSKSTFDEEKEEQANNWAAKFLIPKNYFNEIASKAKSNRLNKRAVKQYARELNIASGIIVGQLQHSKVLDYKYMNDLKRKFEWKHNIEKQED